MIEDRQVRKLFKLLSSGMSLRLAALRSGMSETTARRYRALEKLPSDAKVEHDWRTRKDPFEAVWPAVEEQLRLNPGLQAKTLFQWLQREYPEEFQDGQLRTLQRRVKQWRAMDGPAKEVFFSQTHHPGDLAASDFTHMTSLNVTIAGQLFDHMVYHFVLTYSNWEAVQLCYSESFQSLSDGLQHALWKLGGVPLRHRTDRLSAAVNNPNRVQQDEESVVSQLRATFTARYEALMNHYDLQMEKTQPRRGNENGDVESSHRHYKEAVNQALMMRGSRDFADLDAYKAFLQEIVESRNSGRTQRLAEEQAILRDLPSKRLDSHRKISVLVNSGSLIQVQGNTYSVHSRLIGEYVQIRIFADHLEVWYAQRRIDHFPRLRGRGKHRVNYRHIIDWLVRKPGAFENYRYREDLFPTSHFRMAYDELCERRSRQAATKDYLELLRIAAYENESAVEAILRRLLGRGASPTEASEEPWTIETVRAELLANETSTAPCSTEVHVEPVDLNQFDLLLEMHHDDASMTVCQSGTTTIPHDQDKEVSHDQHGCEPNSDNTTSRTSAAVVP